MTDDNAAVPQVIIVGSGVMGASVAWHLASKGCRDILVIDRGNGFGEGNTPRATGGFRAQFSSEINIALSLLAREKLRRFEEEVGVDSGYRPYGYLFVARSEAAMNHLRSANALQQRCGLREARLVSASEARSINPVIEDFMLVGGAFCPNDGFIRAMQILRGYADAAARMGVRFEFGVDVERFETEGNRVTAVRTSRGSLSADHFVNAAGAWAAMLGPNVPVSPLRRQVATTVPTDVLPETTPMTIWVDDGFHLRVRDGRVLLLWPDPAPIGFDATFDPAWLERIDGFVRQRTPSLLTVEIDRPNCWAGLYEMSPDRHAILGRAPGLSNLYLVNGSSGHGVMHSPALGHLLAEMIVDGAFRTMDATPLRPTRFAEGAAIVSSELL